VSAPTGAVLLVPRGGAWGASVAAAATELGLTPWVLPLIETLPAPSDELTTALDRLVQGDYDWLAVTSAAAVPALAGVVVPTSTQVAAVGEATAHALGTAGIAVHLVGDGGASALLDSWPAEQPGRVLAVQSDLARPVLVDGLADAGWRVDAVVAYCTAAARLTTAEEHALRTGKADIALVTSGSVARRLADVGVPETTRLVAIGAQTAEEVRAAGLAVTAVAASPTLDSLLLAAQEVS
jgi:uroporphyrinogen-III synthase